MAACTAPSSPVAAPLYDALRKMGIEFEEITHPAVMNMTEMADKLPQEVQAKGGLVKNLFLYDKKKRYYLLSALHDSSTNIKNLAAVIGAPGLRMADGVALKDKLGVEAGSVTPMAVINDPTQSVTIIFDEKMKQQQNLLVHPLHNEATLVMAKDDIVKYIEAQGHTIKWVDLTETTSPVAAKTSPVAAKKTTSTASKAVDKPAAPTDASQMGISASKMTDFANWYSQVICKAEMIQYYDVSGCYIIRPWAFFIWEKIVEFMNAEFKKLGISNCYFPMFVKRARLEVEKTHVEGFSPEVAWVTKYGDSDLAEPIAIRPTSETIMYPAYQKWIRSHRDLPMLLNQWNSVVRWEFKQPTPFIRTREFLWQEGHTAHATDEEAEELTFKILDIYARAYEELLAVPMVKGIKSEGEKFAGAKMTTTIEGYIPAAGRGIQAATSHHLGTNFSKMFGIDFEDKNREKQLVHQTSFGFTTRSVGVMTMTHGDDDGLVLPPFVAPKQVVIVPILYKEENSQEMVDKCDELAKTLKNVDVRVEVDDRDNYTPGWKYNFWEVKGVPLRMELGPRDLKNQQVRIVRRDNKEAKDVKWTEIAEVVPKMLREMHDALLAKARREFDDNIVEVREWDKVVPTLNARKLVMAPWCCEADSEEIIKAKTSGEVPPEVADVEEGEEQAGAPLSGAMKALCIPLDQRPLEANAKCFVTGKPATKWCLFGRSY